MAGWILSIDETGEVQFLAAELVSRSIRLWIPQTVLAKKPNFLGCVPLLPISLVILNGIL